MTDKDFEEKFANPPREYYPVPFWFLNSDLNEREIESCLVELKNKHIYSVFMHPRTGLEIKYLSDEYWKRINFILRKIEELEMTAWLYDEYNWPSGVVGGKILREHPEYRQTYLDYVVRKTEKGKEVEVKIEGEFISATAVETETGEIVNLDGYVSNDVLRWTPTRGSWNVVVFFKKLNREIFFNTTCAPWTKGEEGYLDLLNHEAVKKFIELTHEEYAKRFKGYFGKIVLGMFTDEPANYYGLPWTSGFFEKFKEEKGYDLRLKLHELALDVGDYVKTRCDYHDVALKLYEEAFFKQIKEWCEENDLKFTGHLFMEELLSTLPVTQGSFFSTLRNMHIPGIDYLSDKTGYEPVSLNDTWGSNLAAKSLSSTAHAIGVKRTLCEIFGGCGWGTSLEKLLNVINWAAACGINFINPHACHVSLKGLRKRDFPASHFVQEPWWKYYDKFSDYVARVSYLSSLGTHVADVALLYPMRSLWAEHTLRKVSEKFRFMKESFLAIVNALLRIQRDYDFLFEEIVREGRVKVERGFLKVNEETFKVLVLPPTMIMPREVVKLARAFFESGGKVIALGCLPRGSEEKVEDPEVVKDIENIFKSEAKSSNGETWIVNQNEKGGKAIFIPFKEALTMEKAENLLKEALDNCIPRDISIETPESRWFIYLHRRLKRRDLYFIANLSDKRTETAITLNVIGRLEKLDPMTGEIVPVPVYDASDGKIVVPYVFNGREAVWFMISRDKDELPHVEDANITVTKVKAQREKIIVEGFSRTSDPYVKVDGKKVKIPSEKILDKIVLSSTWRVTIPKKNTMVIEPWTVKLIDAAWKTAEMGEKVDFSRYIPARIMFMLRALSLIAKIKELFSMGKRTFLTSRYSLIEDLADELSKTAQRLGINVEELGIYEGMRIILGAATEAGLLPPSIPLGASYVMDATFNVDYISEDIELIYEDLGEPIEIYMNNMKITETPREEFVWDSCNRVIPIKNYLKTGRNTIRIKSRLPSFLDKAPSTHGIEPVVLRGRFMVRDKSICEFQEEVETDDLRKIGFPNYSGEVIYRQSFVLNEEYLKKKLILEFTEVKETAEVWINGKKVGERITMPYILDITEFVVTGENHLEIKVNNTLENLFGTGIPSGILGPVTIVPYNKHSLTIPL